MANSKELTAFKKHFESNTGIDARAFENRTFFHWKRLAFNALHCEELEAITKYIRDTFSVAGKYTHKLPMIVTFDGVLTLTVDEDLIKEFIM